MNKESILTEGFFDKIKKYFKDQKTRKKVANDPKVKKSIKDLNSAQEDLEQWLSKLSGEKVTLSRYDTKDFLK